METKPPILFLTNSSVGPLSDGKRQRSWFLMNALVEKYTVDVLFIGFQDEYDKFTPDDRCYRNLYFISVEDSGLSGTFFKKLYSIFFSSSHKKIQERFHSIINEQQHSGVPYKFIFSRYVHPLLMTSIPERIPVVCDIDDVFEEVGYSRFTRTEGVLKKIRYILYFKFTNLKIKRIYRQLSSLIVIKDEDKRFSGLERANVLPNLPFAYYLPKKDTSTFPKNELSNIVRLGFIGKLSYRPNYEGLEWFLQNIWPFLISSTKKYELVIAGSGELPQSVFALLERLDDVKYKGLVQDVNEFWSCIDLFIAPVAEGGGSNIKVAEALINGKAVIAHPFAARGFQRFIDKNMIFPVVNKHEWVRVIDSIHITSEWKSKIKRAALEAFNLKIWQQKLHAIVDRTFL